MLAEDLGMLDCIEEECSAIDAALLAAESSGLAYWNAEQHRRRAEPLWPCAGGPVEECARASLLAFELARSQNARLFELRAAMTAFRIAEGEPEMRTTRALLQHVYERYSEGFGTADLEEAGRLLGMATP
jgi:predicted ATPase